MVELVPPTAELEPYARDPTALLHRHSEVGLRSGGVGAALLVGTQSLLQRLVRPLLRQRVRRPRSRSLRWQSRLNGQGGEGASGAGEFRAVIDREYPLDAIADAYRYAKTEQKTGIVVINVRSVNENAHGLLVHVRK